MRRLEPFALWRLRWAANLDLLTTNTVDRRCEEHDLAARVGALRIARLSWANHSMLLARGNAELASMFRRMRQLVPAAGLTAS